MKQDGVQDIIYHQSILLTRGVTGRPEGPGRGDA